jgi:hypothetical protein
MPLGIRDILLRVSEIHVANSRPLLADIAVYTAAACFSLRLRLEMKAFQLREEYCRTVLWDITPRSPIDVYRRFA